MNSPDRTRSGVMLAFLAAAISGLAVFVNGYGALLRGTPQSGLILIFVGTLTVALTARPRRLELG